MKRMMVSVGGAVTLILGATASVAGAPAVNEGYDWTMRVNEEERAQSAILAYEVTDTDDQPLAFSCEEGGNRIFASISGNSPDLTAIDLASGDQKLRLTGTTDAEEIPYFSSEEIAGGSPFIRAFAANGWLRMTADGATVDMAATPGGKQAITRFVTFCAG
ncbi:hypothetical protein FHR22_000884 [Sphingopyxis panaciterrae]|uniref:hypothetical protein n=1 Tax=Sphingopyxis panaciterrae TaxID=363841 RepID=UPI00142340D8|nr:hypothetical protein [Sphingopyxis panaciterrae]NIJ36235.1 hypothetical protein [Sphingopyxis panaciterrae]